MKLFVLDDWNGGHKSISYSVQWSECVTRYLKNKWKFIINAHYLIRLRKLQCNTNNLSWNLISQWNCIALRLLSKQTIVLYCIVYQTAICYWLNSLPLTGSLCPYIHNILQELVLNSYQNNTDKWKIFVILKAALYWKPFCVCTTA